MSLHLCSQERGDISIQVHPMLENPVPQIQDTHKFNLWVS